MSRLIQIELDREMSQFLNQEKSRLYTRYGIKVTQKEIIKTLLRQHSLRVISEADEQQELLWYYDNLKEQNESTATPRTSTAAERRRRNRV